LKLLLVLVVVTENYLHVEELIKFVAKGLNKHIVVYRIDHPIFAPPTTVKQCPKTMPWNEWE